MITGEGVMRYANGESYTGEWRNMKRGGVGKHCYADTSEFEGSWLVSLSLSLCLP